MVLCTRRRAVYDAVGLRTAVQSTAVYVQARREEVSPALQVTLRESIR